MDRSISVCSGLEIFLSMLVLGSTLVLPYYPSLALGGIFLFHSWFALYLHALFPIPFLEFAALERDLVP